MNFVGEYAEDAYFQKGESKLKKLLDHAEGARFQNQEQE